MSEVFKKNVTVKLNCHGGILPTGLLSCILDALHKINTENIRFGLRQCIYADIHHKTVDHFVKQMKELDIPFEIEEDLYPNIMSGYPAEEIFPTNTWLSEGVYKDILDSKTYDPRLKINISDPSISFTPFFTGNINWLASIQHPHYWHLYVRYPKTNHVLKCKSLIYTSDIMHCSQSIEDFLLFHSINRKNIDPIQSSELEAHMGTFEFTSIPDDEEIQQAAFSMPYYEGLNQQDDDHYWLGVYKRDEGYSVAFLRDLCVLCLDTRIGQVCITPWKSIIIKGIEKNDRSKWIHLLNQHQINVRHPLNELNFQIEDNSEKALRLKKYIVNHFNEDDTRTHGLCFGIKTRAKSEIFSNIMIRRTHLIEIGFLKMLPVYDILVAKDFNPNERTGYVFASGLFLYLLPEHLSQCISSYYNNHPSQINRVNHTAKALVQKNSSDKAIPMLVFQCNHCLTWMDPSIVAESISDYNCSVCDAPGTDFTQIDQQELINQPV